MDQIQVKVVQLQQTQRFVDGFLCAFKARVLHPQLGGDKQIFTRHARVAQPFAHSLFVFVRGRRVNQTVASLDRVNDAALALLRIRNLEDPKTQHGHLVTVVQCDVFHESPESCVGIEL